MPRITLTCVLEPTPPADAPYFDEAYPCREPKASDPSPATYAPADSVGSAPVAAIDPATILAFIEIAKQIAAWFRSRR
jgi:hypothetical protein